jgi:nitrate reductase NapA
MTMLRRDFVRNTAAAAAAAAAGVPLPGQTQTAAGADPAVKWSKAPCRFCCTGCGVTWR